MAGKDEKICDRRKTFIEYTSLSPSYPHSLCEEQFVITSSLETHLQVQHQHESPFFTPRIIYLGNSIFPIIKVNIFFG